MFFRTKTSGPRTYLQIVENHWEDGRTRQRVVATLGRLDQLQQSGQLDALLVSGARLAQSVLLLSAHAQGQLPTITTRRIGPALIFQRLWQQTGCQRVIEQLLDGRRFECDVERAVFLTVLHRLFDPGSDRAADKWKDRLPDRGVRTAATAPPLPGHGLARRGVAPGPADGQDAVRTPLHQGPDRGGDLRPPAGSLHRSATGLLRHHLDLLRGRGWPGHRPAGLQQGPSARPVPDGRGGGARRPGAADLLRTVAGQHHRRDDADPGRGSPAEAVRGAPGLHRGGPGHDQPGDDRGVGATGAGLAVHPGGPDAVAERGARRGAVPSRSLPGRASASGSRATIPHP